MRFYFVFFMMVLALTSILADDKTGISGIVHSEKTGEKLFNVTIVIKGTDQGAVTDFNGKYEIRDCPHGEFILTAKLMGYKDQKKKILIKKNEINKVDFILKEDVIPMNEILVSDYKLGKEIDMEKRDRFQAVNLSDLLRGEPDINIGGGAVNASRIYVGGIEASNMNVTIDGAKQGQNLFQHRGNMSQIEPEILKKIKIEQGAVRADQGYGSLGGSIRFETADPGDLLKGDNKLGGFMKTTVASADESYRGSLGLYGKLFKNVGVLAYVSGVNTSNYRIGGGGEVDYSGGQDREYFGKINYQGENQTLKLMVDQNTNKGTYLWGAGDYYYKTNTKPPSKQDMDRLSASLNYHYNSSDKPWLNFEVNLYNNESSLKNDNQKVEYSSEVQGGKIAYNTDIKLNRFENRLVVGLDYMRDRGKTENNSGKGHYGKTIENDNENLGYFLQNNLYMGKLDINFGLRLDDFETDFKPKSISGTEISPNISFKVDILEGLFLYCGYGRSIRSSGTIPVGFAANIADTVKYRGGKLDPEYSNQIKGGISYRRDNFHIPGLRLNGKVDYYHNEIDNLISYVGGRRGEPVTELYNEEGTFKVDGVDFSLALNYQRLGFSYSFSHIEVEDVDGEAAGVVRRRGAGRGDRSVWDLNYQFSHDLRFGYMMTYVAALNDVAENTPDRRDYFLNGVQVVWSPRMLSNFSFYFAVNNLFDEKYSEHTSFANSEGLATEEKGRDFRITLKYGF